MSAPKELFWMNVRLSGDKPKWRATAGIRGGKRSSLKACLESRDHVLRFDPRASVRIFQTKCDWEEVI